MQFNLSADKKELPADVGSDMVAMHFISILRILSAYLWLVRLNLNADEYLLNGLCLAQLLACCL